MLFRDKLKALRETKGLTQEQLARASGMSVGNVRNYEQGIRLPSFPLVVKLAAALGTTCAAFADCADVIRDDGQTSPAPKKGRPK